MSLVLSSLTAYTEQNKFDLISKTVAEPRTMQYATMQTGIKSSATINLMDSDVVFQSGANCGWSASGTTTLTQRTITVGAVTIQEALCPQKLNAYYTQVKLNPGKGENESLPFEQLYTSLKIAKIGDAVETAIWQGDTASGTANLSKFDGLIKIIDAATDEILATTAADVTTSTIRGIIENIYSLLPTTVLNQPDLFVAMGQDNFRTLVTKLTTDNLYHYTTDAAAGAMEIMYPGNGLRIVALPGLNGTDRIFALRESNIYIGTDLEHEEERFSIRYSEDNDEVRFRCDFKMGVQVAFPSEIVSYKNT